MATREETNTGVVGRLREFMSDARAEFWKVSWPSRSELRDSTVVVIVTVLIVSGFIGIVDRILSFGVTKLFG